MDRNKAPEKIYLSENPITEEPDDKWLSKRSDDNDIEYTRTDAFIEKACEFLFQYNKNQALKHGAKAILGCGEYTINVEDFRKYMKGQ